MSANKNSQGEPSRKTRFFGESHLLNQCRPCSILWQGELKRLGLGKGLLQIGDDIFRRFQAD